MSNHQISHTRICFCYHLYHRVITKEMDRNNLNAVVFDEEESFSGTEYSRMNNSVMRRQTSDLGGFGSNPHLVISNEIHMLNDKIKSLQEKTVKIQQSLKNTLQNSASAISSAASIPPQSTQVDELLRLIQTKIQVIIQETKKIIEKLSNEFDRKLAQSSGQKEHESNAIGKIQKHCRDSISQMEQHYQKEIMLVRDEHQAEESRMLGRVQQIEKQYRVKIKGFESKEAEYLSTIEHLENRLRMANKNKKMMEVTQEKPNMSIKCDIMENISGVNNINSQSINGLSPHDTSVSKRRTRIFDSKRSNNSVSPHAPSNQVLSPFKSGANGEQSQGHYQNKKQKIEGKGTSGHYPIQSVKSQISPDFKPERVQLPSSMSQAYNKENSKVASRKLIKDQSQKEFYRDLPKAEWEKFQDYDENESSGSEEDVFFYPEHVREEPGQVFKYEDSNEKMFSPFDVN